MHEKDNYLKTAELSTEQNQNMIDGVPNNTPLPTEPPELDKKPLDKLPLEVRHLRDAGGVTELLHHLGGEPLTVVPTRCHGLVGIGLKGSGVGLIGCHADFLLKL